MGVEWTPQAISAGKAYRKKHYLDKGLCPDSGEELKLDNPVSDVPLGRLSCAMCDCFGFDPNRPLTEQDL